MQTVLKPSKKFKLPRSEWVKGKSKFLQMRMIEEINAAKKALKEKVNTEMVVKQKQSLLAFFKQIVAYVRTRLFAKVKKG